MQSYINDTLDEYLEHGKLLLNDAGIILKIADKLERESQGTQVIKFLLLHDLSIRILHKTEELSLFPQI